MDWEKFRVEPRLNLNDSRDKIFRLIFIESGNAAFKIDFATYNISGPTLVFISEHQLLSILPEDDTLSGRSVYFANDFFCIKLNRSETFCDAVIFNTTKPPYIELDAAEAKKIDYLFTAMGNELEEGNDFQEEIITSQLKTLLLYSSKVKLKQFGEVNLSVLSPIVASFQNLLDRNYERQHGVQYYADQLNISPKGLNKAMKKELGRTVSELIKEKLIVEAKRELYTKALSIKEIGFKLGFEDPAYFSRFFKKETSHSPKEYSELM